MPACRYCDGAAVYRDRTTGDYLCRSHAWVEVTGPRASVTPVRDQLDAPPVIRTATAADRSGIAQLTMRFWGEAEIDCFGSNYPVAELDAYVACVDDSIVGNASYAREGDALDLVALNVLPEWQGWGLGQALMDAVIGQARACGAARVVLATTNDNLLALMMYQRLGFVITGVQVGTLVEHHGTVEYGFGGIPVRDEIQMELRL